MELLATLMQFLLAYITNRLGDRNDLVDARKKIRLFNYFGEFYYFY